MYGKYRYFTNRLKTGDIMSHAQCMCKQCVPGLSLGGGGGGWGGGGGGGLGTRLDPI